MRKKPKKPQARYLLALPLDLKGKAHRAAERKDVTLAQYIRQALREKLEREIRRNEP